MHENAVCTPTSPVWVELSTSSASRANISRMRNMSDMSAACSAGLSKLGATSREPNWRYIHAVQSIVMLKHRRLLIRVKAANPAMDLPGRHRHLQATNIAACLCNHHTIVTDTSGKRPHHAQSDHSSQEELYEPAQVVRPSQIVQMTSLRPSPQHSKLKKTNAVPKTCMQTYEPSSPHLLEKHMLPKRLLSVAP